MRIQYSMKKKAILATLGFLLVAFILLPAVIVLCCGTQRPKDEPNNVKQQIIKVLDTAADTVVEMDFEEYIICVVAAEMPVAFEAEALKAQAVASRTFTHRRLESGSGHEKGDICTDYTHCQAFISKEERYEKWQESGVDEAECDARMAKIESAVSATQGEVMRYDGELVSALYHSSSGGKTENSEDYFVSALPYLRSVESAYEGDTYTDIEKAIPIAEFTAKIKEKRPETEININQLAEEVAILSYTTGGKVDEIQIGNVVFEGREVRELFGLRSSGFDVRVETENVVFTTKGNGHGVGMSQYGANGYAQQGYEYRDILKHYYTGIIIEQYK